MHDVRKLLDGFASIAVAGVALWVGWVQFQNSRPAATRPESQPTFEARWRDAFAIANHDSDSLAPVQIVEFSDFQCPFCARFNETLKAVRAKRPNRISVAFVHLPIESHPFALAAANASQCAAEQNFFWPFVDKLFQRQDSIGKKAFRRFAVESGVPDVAGFQSCVDKKLTFEKVQKGPELGKAWKIRGTPTVYINGWRQPKPPDEAELTRLVDSIAPGGAEIVSRSSKIR
jgi:protein-disulfide isomerase